MLYIDLETRSERDLLKVGVVPYADAAEITVCAWAVDDGPVQSWDMRTPGPPEEFIRAFSDADALCAHNVTFERELLRRVWNFESAITTWVDTAAWAKTLGYPDALMALGPALQVPEELLKFPGKKLIELFCSPPFATPDTHPQEWEEFVEYCRQDVVVLREVHKRLQRTGIGGRVYLDSFERQVQYVHERINMRGIPLDKELVERLAGIVSRTTAGLDDALEMMTDGAVTTASQRDRILRWAAEQGYELPSLTKQAVAYALRDPACPKQVREVLRLRSYGAKSSTAKFETMMEGMYRGRIFDVLNYYGADQTGRWSARRFQAHNLPRSSLSSEQIETAVRAIRSGLVDVLYDDLLELSSLLLRACVQAPVGRTLAIADWSNIEGRMVAWLAGDADKLERFREQDLGGPGVYELSYARSFGVPVEEVTKLERQVGKVQELALGYEGGADAYGKMAMTYDIDLEALTRHVMKSATPKEVSRAEYVYDHMTQQGRVLILDRPVFIACDVLKQRWRSIHPDITNLWRRLKGAAHSVVAGEAETVEVGSLKVGTLPGWLTVELPSGRVLVYKAPRLRDGQLTYLRRRNRGPGGWGWFREGLFGGSLTENVTQAAARDVLARALVLAELSASLNVVLHVHDEIVVEGTPASTLPKLLKVMEDVPEWVPGLPLRAEGAESRRYVKP